MQKVRVGSRGSALALEQTQQMIAQLQQVAPQAEFELVVIKTKGDIVLDVSLDKVGGKGLFTKEIEEALLRHEVDLAVHSLKDLPTQLPDGLTLGAVTKRVDPWDVLIAREGLGLDELPQGARVGTSSLRRAAQLRHYRPDLDVVSIRGNVDTRLRKLETEGLDAIVMAAAGLTRLGLAGHITQVIPPEIMLPAVGQGALGIEVRQDDVATRRLVAALHDRNADLATRAERALLARFGGGCQVPLGALGQVTGADLRLDAMVADPDGYQLLRASRKGPVTEAFQIGQALAEELLGMGAGAILATLADQPPPAPAQA